MRMVRAATQDGARRKRGTTFPFGIKGSDISRLLVSMLAAGGVSFVAMHYSVEGSKADIERNAAAIAVLSKEHRELEQRVVELEAATALIEFRQSQSETLASIGDTLRAILDELLQRPRRRKR